MPNTKKVIPFIGVCIFLITNLPLAAQNALDSIPLKSIKGQSLPFGSIVKKDTLVLICFWSTNSDISQSILNSINSSYDDWKKKVHFRMLAVCMDQGKEANRAKGISNMNEWKFEVLTDYTGGFQEATHASTLPYCIILKSGKQIYQQAGYELGTEKYLIQKLESLANGKQ